MDVHKFYEFFFRFFRKKRMGQFSRTFSPVEQTKILDVGGTPYNWVIRKCSSQITLLNLSEPEDIGDVSVNISCDIGNGTALKYSDSEFDICFSNSVIEHLSTFENQKAFAHEVSRVGKKIWVQTPAKSFFVEPHLMTPFIHYFSKRIQKKTLRNFTLWGWVARPSQEIADRFLSEVRLLTYDEMGLLFPDCEIRREKFFGFTKAYIAVRQ